MENIYVQNGYAWSTNLHWIIKEKTEIEGEWTFTKDEWRLKKVQDGDVYSFHRGVRFAIGKRGVDDQLDKIKSVFSSVEPSDAKMSIAFTKMAMEVFKTLDEGAEVRTAKIGGLNGLVIMCKTKKIVVVSGWCDDTFWEDWARR